MKNILGILIFPLFLMGLALILITGCKKEENTPPAETPPEMWGFGPTSTYALLPGNILHDSLSGYDFGFGDISAGGTVKVSRILSGVAAPFAGTGYKIEYNSTTELMVRILCPPGDQVLGMMYGNPNGLYNGMIAESWIGLPNMGTSEDSTGFYFALPQPYELPAILKSSKSRGANLFFFKSITKESTDNEKRMAISMQSLIFLEDNYIAALNPALKSSVNLARNAKSVQYAYGGANSYAAFWRPYPVGTFYPIYHPTINFLWDAANPNAEDIAHETAHYFINLVVGNAVQETLDAQGSIFDTHGMGEVPGRGYVVDEFVYFTETTTGEYLLLQLSEPAKNFSQISRYLTDYPSIEGFCATMLYALVRDKATIQNVNYSSQKLDFPIIGLTYGQVFDIIAQGATNVDHIRANIQEYLSVEGTGTQSERFPVVLQRIGWSYTVQGTLVDSATNAPLEGWAIENIFKGGEGREYNDGQMPRPIDLTRADGTFTLYHTVFPGSSFLRFSKDGMSFDKLITCPYATPTSTVVELSTIKLNPNPPAFAIGQNYGGGIIFYVDGTGQHGLISSATDQGTAAWGCYDAVNPTWIAATGTAIGLGQANTTAIVNGCAEAGIAARLCDDLVLNGYSDWFLPSKDELNQMYLHKSVIGSFQIGIYYWSSSEATSFLAYSQDLESGTQYGSLKAWDDVHVRAIRAF